MGRTACIDLPAFPLQWLLRRRPEWQDRPVAVVDRDRPQGRILWVDERARRRGVLPGLRYAAALALCGELHAAEVPPNEIRRAVAALAERLRRFTPNVEPAGDEPGVFWLDASGLEPLFGPPRSWAGRIRTDLARAGFRATVVVGFTRFGTYALSREKRGVLLVRRPEDERAAARQVPLERLALEPAARDALHRLGVTRVGAFADLPGEGVLRRFGPEVHRLHRLASGELHVPLQPDRPLPPAVERRILDHPETDAARLLHGIERSLRSLLATLSERAQALAGLRLGLRFERLGDHLETIRPAAPTLDADLLLELIRLRLQAVRRLPDGVVEVVLTARAVAAAREQTRLFSGHSRRDPAAGNRALARVRADLGQRSVVRARLRAGHLPEATFAWEPLDALAPARPRPVETGGLVRRMHARPVPLPPRPRHEPDGWMLRGLDRGPVVRVFGPYVVSGGWWNRTVHREYHFAETRDGDMLWLYYDRPRRRWHLQGRLE